MDASLVVQAPGQRRGCAGHGGDCGPAVAGGAQRGHVHARLGADLLSRDVRSATGRLERADVREQRFDPRKAEAVAQEAELLALGVERADQQDGAGLLSGR